jgi:uncharacterized membrane protein YkgB
LEHGGILIVVVIGLVTLERRSNLLSWAIISGIYEMKLAHDFWAKILTGQPRMVIGDALMLSTALAISIEFL